MLEPDGAVVRTDSQWQTATPGIFSGGDVASMDRFVTQAVGMGKYAADEIGRYVNPQHVAKQLLTNPEVPIKEINVTYYPPVDRNQPGNAEVAARLQNFEEVQQKLGSGEAVAEAERCFSCGTCIHCDNCFLYCPDMAITKQGQGYLVNSDYCKGCGLCLAECPTGSIRMQEEA